MPVLHRRVTLRWISSLSEPLQCFPACPRLVHSFIPLQVHALEHGAYSALGRLHTFLQVYIHSSPGAGTAQSQMYIFEAIRLILHEEI